jgi:ABC-type multidrug transport system ATPase subunit
MGPSGCGKTTLLNILGDHIGSKGVQGTITVNGHKPTKNSKRYVAYCTQDDIFFPYLTVKDTLRFTVSTNVIIYCDITVFIIKFFFT